MASLSPGRTSEYTSSTPNDEAIALAVILLSPVTMKTFLPRFCRDFMANRLFSLTSSPMAIRPITSLSFATYKGVQPCFEKERKSVSAFAISIPFMSFAEILRTQYIIPKKEDKIYIVAVCGAAFVNLIINSLLIPRMGAEGAVVGTIASEAAVCIYQAIKVRKELPVVKYAMQYVKYCVPGMLMFQILRFFMKSMSYSIAHLLELVIFGGVIYITVVFAYMAVFERQHLMKIITKVLKR